MSERVPTTPVSMRRHRSLALAFRLVPDFLDEALVPLDTELNDDVNEKVQEAFDIATRQFSAARILLDQQYELLEGEFGAGCMNTGDGPGVARVDIAQIVEGFLGPQLREQ